MGSNRGLAAISFVLLCGAVSMGIIRPMLPLYLDNIGLEPYLLGLVVSVSMIGMVIGESFSGLISDRYGLRLPLVLSTLVCGLALFGFILNTALPFLFIAGFLWGGLRVMMVGPARGYLADAATPQKRATYIAISSAILSLSRGVGALPGGLIVDNLGFDWVFYVAGGISVIGAIAAFTGPKRPPVFIPSIPIAASVKWRKVLPVFIYLCVIGAFGFLNIAILLTYVPLLGTQVMGITATSVGLILTVNGLATMAFSVPMGMVADKIGKRPAMILGLVICGAAMAGVANTLDFGWLIGWGAVHALGMAVFMSAVLGVLSDVMPAGRLATAMGLYGGIGENSGLVLGSAIGGFVWDGIGIPATFYTAVIACALGIVLCLFLGKAMPVNKPVS